MTVTAPHITQEPAGLTTQEAARLLAQTGPNVIAEAKGPSHLRRFAANFVQLLALVLWAGAPLALVAGMPELSVAIGSPDRLAVSRRNSGSRPRCSVRFPAAAASYNEAPSPSNTRRYAASAASYRIDGPSGG